MECRNIDEKIEGIQLESPTSGRNRQVAPVERIVKEGGIGQTKDAFGIQLETPGKGLFRRGDFPIMFPKDVGQVEIPIRVFRIEFDGPFGHGTRLERYQNANRWSAQHWC